MVDKQNHAMEEPNPTHSSEIYTIGHGRLSIADFMRFLAVNLIKTVIDVRSVPYSKFAPQFNKTTLEITLPDSGIEYRFAGKFLGGFPDGRRPENLKTPDWNTLAEREDFKRGIKRLEQLMKSRRLIIMCAEENPYRCHRHHLISTALLKLGISVIHLRHDGKKDIVTEVQNRLF